VATVARGIGGLNRRQKSLNCNS